MPLFTPNKLTEFAVRRPLLFSALSALSVVGLAFGTLQAFDAAIVLGAAAAGGSLMFVFNLVVWQPSGPGTRWYRRNTGRA